MFEFDGHQSGLLIGASSSEIEIGVKRVQVLFDILPKHITPSANIKLAVQGCRVVTNNGDGPVSIPTLVTGTGDAKKIKNSAFAYRIGEVNKVKAAAETVFDEAHVVTALKYGVIGVYLDAAGTIQTLVKAASQITAQGYDNLSDALDNFAKITPPADTILIGKIGIQAGAANWDANTDDLTPASGLVAVRYMNEISCFTDTDTHDVSAEEFLDGKGGFFVSEQKPEFNYRVAVISNDGNDLVKITGVKRSIQ